MNIEKKVYINVLHNTSTAIHPVEEILDGYVIHIDFTKVIQ
jgi:hypothetical protein